MTPPSEPERADGAGPSPYELPDERVRAAWERLIGEYLICDPLEPELAERILASGAGAFLELGAATAPISRLLQPHGVDCLAFDLNPPDGHFRPMVQGDLRALPFRDGSFDGVAAVNCLYFLADPVQAVAQAKAVLAPGGTFVASAPSRVHDPELAEVLEGWGTRGTFDAEDAAAIVGRVFDDIDARWWEVPAFHLPDHAAVVDYLVAFKQPEPERRAERVSAPVSVTKSGCDVWARR